jgi:hypothetical protein
VDDGDLAAQHRHDVVGRQQALVVLEHHELAGLDGRCGGLVLGGLDLVLVEGGGQGRAVLEGLELLERDAVDPGVLVAEEAVGPGGAVGRAAEHDLILQRLDVGDLGDAVLVGEGLQHDEGVLVLGLRVVVGDQTLVLEGVLQPGVRLLRVGRRDAVRVELGGGAAGVVDDQVDVAVAQARVDLLAEALGRLDLDLEALGLQELAVDLGEGLALGEVLRGEADGLLALPASAAAVVVAVVGRRAALVAARAGQQAEHHDERDERPPTSFELH